MGLFLVHMYLNNLEGKIVDTETNKFHAVSKDEIIAETIKEHSEFINTKTDGANLQLR